MNKINPDPPIVAPQAAPSSTGGMVERLTKIIRGRMGAFGSPVRANALAVELLEALREPDKAMLDAVRDFYRPHFDKNPEFIEDWAEAARDNHHRMIDAALQEPSK